MMMPKIKNIRWNFKKVVVFFACFITAMTVTWQVNCVVKNGMYKYTRVVKISDLQNQLLNEKRRNAELSTQVNDFQKLFKNVPAEDLQNKDYLEAVTKRLQQVEEFAGLTEVEGPGVLVTINEGPSNNDPDEDYLNMDNITHDYQLSAVVNNLLSADSEAISINGQRLVSTSEIHCAGPTISINNKRLASPYEIKAIGDPNNLVNSLNMKGGIVELLRFYKIEVKIEKKESIRIEKYEGGFKNKYIKEVGSESTIV